MKQKYLEYFDLFRTNLHLHGYFTEIFFFVYVLKIVTMSTLVSLPDLFVPFFPTSNVPYLLQFSYQDIRFIPLLIVVENI